MQRAHVGAPGQLCHSHPARQPWVGRHVLVQQRQQVGQVSEGHGGCAKRRRCREAHSAGAAAKLHHLLAGKRAACSPGTQHTSDQRQSRHEMPS